jgi:hypothetical protein
LGSLNLENDNIINLEEYKKQRKEDREEYYKTLSVATLKAFEPDCYYINPEKGTMIHVLFITDKSDIFDREMIYVMEDPSGVVYCAPVDEDTCKGWHELADDVFAHEVLKKRYESELPPFPDPEPTEPTDVT